MTDRDFERLLAYIHNHLDRDLSLRTLAKRAKLSPFHFHRIMADRLGETLHQYVIRLRMEEAARLLKSTELSAGEIGKMVGYKAPAVFNHIFQAYYGQPPGRFRIGKRRR